MELLFYWLDKGADWSAAPFGGCSDERQLLVLSLVCAVILLLVFKSISRQDQIRIHKNLIYGYILETGIFRDQIGRILLNQVRILKHNMIYLRYVAAPFLLLMLPVVFVCVELDSRQGYQPLETGSQFILRADLDDAVVGDVAAGVSAVHCETSAGLVLDTAPLRLPGEGGVMWRVRVVDAGGPNYIRVSLAGTHDSVTRPVATGGTDMQISPEKTKLRSWNYLFSFFEPPIEAGSSFRSVRVSYQRATVPMLTMKLDPVIWFFVLTILFGLLVKPLIKVSF